MSLIRLYEPTDLVDLTRVRALLEAAEIPYSVEGEHYFAAAGGFLSHGDTRVFIQVDASWVDRAKSVIDGANA